MRSVYLFALFVSVALVAIADLSLGLNELGPAIPGARASESKTAKELQRHPSTNVEEHEDRGFDINLSKQSFIPGGEKDVAKAAELAARFPHLGSHSDQRRASLLYNLNKVIRLSRTVKNQQEREWILLSVAIKHCFNPKKQRTESEQDFDMLADLLHQMGPLHTAITVLLAKNAGRPLGPLARRIKQAMFYVYARKDMSPQIVEYNLAGYARLANVQYGVDYAKEFAKKYEHYWHYWHYAKKLENSKH